MRKKWEKTVKKVFLSAMLVMMTAACFGCGGKEPTRNEEQAAEKQEQQSGEEVESQVTQPVNPTREPEKYTFPVLLDSDRLELHSVFEYTGMNPDYEDVYAEEIASVQLKNVSGSYLESAQLQVTLSNGDVFEFQIEDVPADMEVMAFELQNMIYDDMYRVEDIQVEAEYGENDAQDSFSWSVSGSEITVENISDQEMKNVTVHYHCTIDGLGYGGKSYELSVGDLNPGESATVTDMACFVGDVTVVNVTHE